MRHHHHATVDEVIVFHDDDGEPDYLFVNWQQHIEEACEFDDVVDPFEGSA